MAINFNNKDIQGASKSFPGLPLFKSATWSNIIRYIGRPVKPSELIFFTTHLSLMIEIDTPMNQALKAIESQTKNTAFKKVIHSMVQDVEEGKQLSDAMKRHPRVFNSMFISMVKGGESGGFLNDALDKIAEMQEKRKALTNQIRSALTYPAFLCVLGFVVVIFIMVSVLPKFTALFAGKESVLPFTTRFLMQGSTFLQSYWWLCIISLIGLIIGLKFFKESKHGQALIDWFLVSSPLVSRISNKIYTNELLRILGNLIESKVPLLDALEVTRGAIRNRYFRNFIEKIIIHVEHGGKFSQPFATYPYILDSVKQMVSTGEETGNLPKTMLRLTRFYDIEVEQELKRFATMIEPVALVVMGAVVGLIVSSVILPMFKLAHAVG